MKTIYGKTVALGYLYDRRASRPTPIDNASLPAGSPMYFYCVACGHVSDVKAEDYLRPPARLCDECQALKTCGWLEDAYQERTGTVELNPNHGVTQETRDQWHKLCVLLMMKMGVTKVVFTEQDINKLQRDGGTNIVVCPSKRENTITLELVDDVTAAKLARAAGGLPV